MDSLHRLGELWHRTFTNSPIGIAIANPKGKFVMVNASLCKLLGYTEEQLLRYRWQDLTHPEDLLQEISLIFDIATSDRDGYKIYKRYICKDLSVRAVVSLVSAIRNPDSELQYLLNQVVDITELNKLRAIAKTKLTPDLKADIQLALQQSEFYLEYEPVVCLNSGKVVGHEGLIRWTHPTKGKIAPLDWIPACEEDVELMAQICAFVVREGLFALRDRQSWLSVNISPVSLTHESFIKLLDNLGMVSDKPKLFLEITERSPLDFAKIGHLQLLGYGIFLDDFGQGHSSVIQLLRLIDVVEPSFLKIKVDGWFTRSLEDKNTALIMREFVGILHRFNLDAIAECIETEAQLKAWQELGCDMGQGWYWKLLA